MAINPVLTKTGTGTYDLSLALNPQGTISLSTLTLKTTLTPDQGKLVSLSSAPTVDSQFKGGGWTFPFNNLTSTPEGGIVLKTSLVFASPEAFTISKETPFVTIPISVPTDTKTLTLVVDPEVSKIYTKQDQLINYTGAGQPINLEVSL